MMNKSEHLKVNEAIWDKWAGSLDGKGWRSDYLRRAQRVVISRLDIKENVHFLDIGCGTGWAVGQVAKLAGNKGSFYGVDLSPQMIARAKEHFKGNDSFHFLISDSESIPLDDNFFDRIICTNAFHHFLNPDKVLKEISRLLKPEGKIFILDPTGDSWMVKALDKIDRLFEPGFVKFYSTQEFSGLFVHAGLKYLASEKINLHQKVHVGEK